MIVEEFQNAKDLLEVMQKLIMLKLQIEKTQLVHHLQQKRVSFFFSDLLEEKRGFKYVLAATITLKRWNYAINRYDVETIYINSEVVTVTNQRFNLSTSYEKLKNILDIWTGQASGWIVDKIEDIYIYISKFVIKIHQQVVVIFLYHQN